MNIVNELHALADRLADDHRASIDAGKGCAEVDLSASDIARAVSFLLEEVILQDRDEAEKLGNWEDAIRECYCQHIIGAHEWVYNQCGYWGHQYCVNCLRAKYPELASLRCSEAIAKVGDISEDEYLAQQKETTE